MEGVNLVGILLVFLALQVFAVGGVGALGLWIAGRTRTARITFAAGMLLAAAMCSLAALSSLPDQYSHGFDEKTSLAVGALSVFVAGLGPFVAALRRPGAFAAVLGCAFGAAAVLIEPFVGCGQSLFAGIALHLGDHLLILTGISLVLAVVGLVIAALPSFAAPADVRGPDRKGTGWTP